MKNKFIIYKYDENEKYFVRKSSTNIWTYCELEEDADIFDLNEAILLANKLGFERNHMFYIWNQSRKRLCYSDLTEQM